jgi:hypothetical protein
MIVKESAMPVLDEGILPVATTAENARAVGERVRNAFREPELVKAELIHGTACSFRRKGRNAWAETNRGGIDLECFVEVPCFDREGMLWIVDIPSLAI